MTVVLNVFMQFQSGLVDCGSAVHWAAEVEVKVSACSQTVRLLLGSSQKITKMII